MNIQWTYNGHNLYVNFIYNGNEWTWMYVNGHIMEILMDI